MASRRSGAGGVHEGRQGLSDKRAEILEWLDMMDRHAAGGGVWVAYGLALAALRWEVEAHEEAKVSDGRGLGYCDTCGEDGAGTPTEWPCPTIERIHAATVGAS
jgi:hypothetical protein